MGTPTIGGDITGAVTEDTGDLVQGDLDDVGFLTGNGDDTWSISVQATYGTASIDPATGQWTYDLDDSNPVVDALDGEDTLTDTFTVLMVDSDGRSDTQDVTITITGVVCFLAGTRIDTKSGPRPIEDLKPGDEVLTERGLRPLAWIGRQRFGQPDLLHNRKLRPIRIKAGALGPGTPSADLWVSRQHRILIGSPLAAAMLGSDRVFIAAGKLTTLPGVSVDETIDDVAYYHLLFDRHEVIYAQGTPTESLYTGPEVFKMVSAEAGREIRNILPHLQTLNNDPEPAYPIPSGRQQKVLALRHYQLSQPLVPATQASRLYKEAS